MKAPIVLLGGGGFIGLALARAFAADGLAVRIVSRRRPADLPRGVRWFRGAVQDRRALRPALAGAGCVFQLACDSVPSTALAPADEMRLNVEPSLRLLEWLPARARLVFVSTGGAIYGDPARSRAREDDPAVPLSSYAAGKAAVEAFLRADAHLNRRDVVILRPANVYGPGQPVAAGFGLVPALLCAAARGEAFRVFGDGSTVRDYLFIDDFCALCLEVARGPSRAGLRIYNAGSGRGRSVMDMLRAAERTTGLPVPTRRAPARRGDVRRIVLDIRRARRELGWTPRTPLEEGLERTWRWYSAR